MRLEQAIFTSVRGARLDGYQLAACSAGINSQIARELTAWGPAHDSLWATEPGAKSINFHGLSDGLYCVSQTSLAGAEYSGRGGGRVYTQMLVVPREALVRFVGDPFQILLAIAASGRMLVHETVPNALPTIPLLGRGSELARNTSADLICAISPGTLADLTEVLTSNLSLTVVTNLPIPRLIQTILHQLSLEERLEVSFNTALRPSSRRPFKLSFSPNDPVQARQSQRISGGRIIEVIVEKSELLVSRPSTLV